MRLEGRVAIVTGAASGIGRASAQLFASEGARVLAVDLPGKGLVPADGIAILEKDIAGADAGQAIVDAARAAFGQLDIVMNNAGIGVNALAEAMTDEQWQRVLDVNLTAQFRLCRAQSPISRRARRDASSMSPPSWRRGRITASPPIARPRPAWRG